LILVCCHHIQTTSSSLRITKRSFQQAAPRLWNKLPHSFREPHPHPGLSPSHYPTHVGSTLSSPPLSTSITPSLFHSRLKTHLFLKSFHADFAIYTHWTDLTVSRQDRFFLQSINLILLQRGCIACNAERCNTYSNSVCPSVRLSVRLSVRHTLVPYPDE